MLPSLKFARCILNFQHHVFHIRLFSQSARLSLVSNKPRCLFRAIGMPKSSLEFYQAPCRQCCWTLLVKTMAGHSKWQNIRHIKAAKDKQKSDLSFKFSQRIRLLIKDTGESNPKFSNKLDRLIQEAKKAGVPNSTIQNAIEGSIASQTASEHYYLEVKCFGPIVLILVISSPTIIRTKSELSTIFRKNKVKLEPRCSEGMFEKKGVIHVTPTEGFDLANSLDLAIEVDAEDVFQESEEDGSPYLKFHCEAKNITSVTSCLKKLDHDVTYSECEYLPTAVYPVNEDGMKLLTRLFEKIYSVPEVVRIFDNVAE
ncbi:probable transcriptional regulatory protein PERMA_0079 [Octopus sinensis]|uniref:Probable transcriptional regulatory protein PERMA_0079 n=1 Tax=Octopus sinensis TaxID=2607531 RepID=A0A6P7SQH1_9MOLL|nr:probable transcriptional regulatory protein PERMA_0079 [Octopus sinensis]XP_036361259.1 probable transcriptional regulatory protein PERMA_0079 [Octopus sinensis]